MKPMKGLIVCLVLLTSIPVLAQQASANASSQQSASTSAAGASVNESSNVNAGANAQMQPVNTELVSKLDSKTAKVGDEVVVKTTANARAAGGMVIPKGSRLVGHVTDVRAHAKGSEDGFLAVQFDRAELKGGQSLAIHSVIESVSPSAEAMAMASGASDDSLGGGLAGGGARTSGGGRGVGGLTGGALSSGGSLAGGATGSLGNTASAAGAGLASTTSATGNISAATTGGLQTATSGTAGLGAHATAIPGVMLAGDATGATSGTLSASRKNVHLDSGTQARAGCRCRRQPLITSRRVPPNRAKQQVRTWDSPLPTNRNLQPSRNRPPSIRCKSDRLLAPKPECAPCGKPDGSSLLFRLNV